jgi:hypothetical protein
VRVYLKFFNWNRVMHSSHTFYGVLSSYIKMNRSLKKVLSFVNDCTSGI